VLPEAFAACEQPPPEKGQICVAEVLVRPPRIPRQLDRVCEEPPTYSKLAVVRCEAVEPGQYVVTTKGLKVVDKVERG
jgi:hypothetical protein